MHRNKVTASLAIVAFFGAGQLNVFAQTTPRIVSTVIDDPSRTIEYWTPERLKTSNPIPLLKPTAAPNFISAPVKRQRVINSPSQAPGTPPESSVEFIEPFDPQAALIESGSSILDYSYPYPFTSFKVLTLLYDGSSTSPFPVFPYSAIGKLRSDQGDCTAAVIRPHLLITARHCIYDDQGRWSTNVMFYPGWNNGPNPRLGNGWPANRMTTWGREATGVKWDIGFIQTLDDDRMGCAGSAGGHPIEYYTGNLGWWSGGDYSKRFWNQFGYPGRLDMTPDGRWMFEAQSSTGAVDSCSWAGNGIIEVGNDMIPGSSGGPWILTFTPGQGGGNNYINGLNSFRCPDPVRPLAAGGPQFLDDNFIALFNSAQADPCP